MLIKPVSMKQEKVKAALQFHLAVILSTYISHKRDQHSYLLRMVTWHLPPGTPQITPSVQVLICCIPAHMAACSHSHWLRTQYGCRIHSPRPKENQVPAPWTASSPISDCIFICHFNVYLSNHSLSSSKSLRQTKVLSIRFFCCKSCLTSDDYS